MRPETTSEEDSRSEFLAAVLGDDNLAKPPESDMEEEADPENGFVLSSGPDDMDLPGVNPNAAAARSGGPSVSPDGDASEDPEKKAPQSSSAAGTETASVAEPAPSSEEDELLLLPCPKCSGELALRQEHIGVEGACVWCEAPIVAGRSGLDRAVKVFLIAADEPAAASPAGAESEEKNIPEATEPSASPVDGGATMAEPEVERAPLPEAAPSDAEPPKAEQEPASPPEAPPMDWAPSDQWAAEPPSSAPANASTGSESDSFPPPDSSAFDLVAAGWGASEETSESESDGFGQEAAETGESETESQEASSQPAQDFSFGTGFGSTPDSESAGGSEDRSAAVPDGFDQPPSTTLQATEAEAGESPAELREESSGTEQNFSFGTGFGAAPEDSGDSENRPAADSEGFNFQPTEPSPAAETRQESSQPPQDFSFGTGFGTTPDSEGAGRPEDCAATVPDGFDQPPSTNFQATETFQPAEPGESPIEPREESPGSEQNFSFGTGFGAAPENSGDSENRPATDLEGSNFQPTEPSPAAEARQESSQPAQNFSFGTGFGSTPENAGEPEDQAAPEGLSQQPSVNFQPAETGQSSTESQEESPPGPQNLSFGTGFGSNPENPENAGRAEDRPAPVAGGFLGAGTNFDSEVSGDQAASDSRDSVGSGFGEFLSASADGPAVRKKSAENPPEDVVAAAGEPGGTYSQPVPWGPPPTPAPQDQPQPAETGCAGSAPAAGADNSNPQWSGLSTESSSEGPEPLGNASAASGNSLEPAEQRPPAGETGTTAAVGFESAPAAGFVPGAAGPATEKPGGVASLDEAPTDLGSFSSFDDAFGSSAQPEASALEFGGDDNGGAPVGFDIPPATGSEAPFSSLETAGTESSLFSQSPQKAESLFGAVEQDPPPTPAPAEPAGNPGFLGPGSGAADSSLFSEPRQPSGSDMSGTFPSAQDKAAAPGVQPAGNSPFPAAAPATEGPAPAPTPLVESRPIGEKGKSRKGLFITMVVVMGLVSGAALASFVLPVGEYVSQARSFMEKKFMPTATWEAADSESER